MTERIYPIGIQTFSKLRERNAIYIDKTAYVYKLAHEGTTYFLSRPRRFGKSLFLSTLESYFQGKKELFQGLAIEKMETDWIEYPVLHFDFSGAKYAEIKNLNSTLDFKLKQYEDIYGSGEGIATFSMRLENLIKNANKKTGHKVVVLVDEYDAPMLDSLNNLDRLHEIRNIMRDFYSPLKSCDQYLQFTFLTGISKFSQLSIFSELNNLENISMELNYAAICGVTEHELQTQLQSEILAMTDKLHITKEETSDRLKRKYDGYHFTEDIKEDIYNPFSLFCALKNKKFENYWFSTGTPTYLTEQIKQYDIDPKTFDEGFSATSDMFDAPTETASSPIPVLYQSGYLTIKDYDPSLTLYTLAYPNEEVSSGFQKSLIQFYGLPNYNANSTFVIKFSELLRKYDLEGALTLMRSFFSSIPYDVEEQKESHYQTVFYLVFRLCTPFLVRVEERSAAGRADAVVETADTVYAFEFKLDGNVDEALKQIDEKGYLISYSANGKRLVKVGVTFDKNLRTIGEWKVKE